MKLILEALTFFIILQLYYLSMLFVFDRLRPCRERMFVSYKSYKHLTPYGAYTIATK